MTQWEKLKREKFFWGSLIGAIALVVVTWVIPKPARYFTGVLCIMLAIFALIWAILNVRIRRKDGFRT